MGYRAHTITQHRDYGSAVFYEYDQFISYFNELQEEHDDLYMNEQEDFFEIDKEIVEKEIKRLSESPDEEFKHKSSYGDTDSNLTIAKALRGALDESPKDCSYIAFEWY